MCLGLVLLIPLLLKHLYAVAGLIVHEADETNGVLVVIITGQY